jgi:uncharacterized membrane protein
VPHEPKGATRNYDIGRLAALGDGIFAIVLTLLVLDLKPPEPPAPGVGAIAQILQDLPDFSAWVVSFVVVARLWMVHHDVLARLSDRCAPRAVLADLAFLASVSLVPFGASLVGSYEFHEPMAVIVFSATLALAAFLLGVFGRVTRTGTDWVQRHHLVVVPAIAAGAVALATVHPLAAMALWMVEALAVVVALALRR